ncbi:hypothetical protein [Mycobacterium servetii]|uniref:ESX-1 secretion-associated protein EspA/EspE-like domain-containing protein n=1 Tax=Mycobacterium servetii TaxID=3237418 RepID=A0ABV4BWJ1_9MYCO
MNTDVLKHTPPSPDRAGQPTLYLPVSGVGDVDDPDENGGDKSVYGWDKSIDRLNTATLNRDPAHTWSYDPTGCGEGCAEMPPAVGKLDPGQALEAPMKRIVEALETVGGALNSHSGEQWVDRVNAVYGPGGHFDIAAIAGKTQDVYESATHAVESVDTAAQSHLDGLHNVIHQARDLLANRWEQLHLKWQDLGLIPFGTSPMALVGAGGMAAWRLWDVYQAMDEHLDTDKPKKAMLDAQAKADSAVKALDEQTGGWTVTPNATPINLGDGHKGKPKDETRDPKTVLTGDVKPADMSKDDLSKKLDALLNSKPDANPLGGGDPLGGGGMPGGGMPSMPSMGGGAPAGGGMPDMPPMKPLDDPKDDPFDKDKDALKDDPFDKDKKDDALKDTDDKDDKDKDHDKDKKADVGDPDHTADPAAAVPPVAGDGTQPAPVDPNSPEARSVTLPSGQRVTFPTAHEAELVKQLMNADPNNPKSLYMAASEAGYQLPPMGQDIGEKVPPSQMQPGDIVSTGQGHQGVFLGNGDVLMEDQSVKKLSDVANFDGPNQGIFRLAEPNSGSGSLDQPVGVPNEEGHGTTSTPGQPVQTAGAPGVPSDTTASAASNPGQSSNVSGMDPGTASAN